MKIVTAALIEDNGKYLIARRAPGQSLAGLWEFPGGKVEIGESLTDCLRREIFEELNLQIEVMNFFHEVMHQYEHGVIKLISFKAKIISGEISLCVHDKVSWLTPLELLKLDLAPADIPIARRL